MFRIAICENDMKDLESLRIGTEQWLEKNVGITASIQTFRDPQELLDCLLKKEKKFDLFLFDIVMPGLDGIQMGKLIRKIDMDVFIIYVTSSHEHALEAYGIQAIRYLVKPLKVKELYSALDLSYTLFCARPRHTLLIRGQDLVTSIIMEEIMYIENNLRSVTYTMDNGQKVVGVRRSGSFENAVGPVAEDSRFIQPHKSFFVNIKYIRALQEDVILMDDGSKIPIARRRTSEIQDKYINYISRENEKIW